MEEINADREANGKKPFDDDDNGDSDSGEVIHNEGDNSFE